jgi:BirA family transcriptional regulator, biotin operon repressor / biotin---[acetyl-CoA-carboxylase] ligase
MTALAEWERVDVRVWANAWGVPGLEAHTELSSTNDHLTALAALGAPDHLVVIAEEQTAGRGRRGAEWFSPAETGLWLSFLTATDAESVPVLPLLAGIAAARAIETVSGVDVRIKWPNDVFVDGRKVGGVLCESARDRVVIGIGLNVRTPPGGFPDEIADRAGALDSLARGTREVSRADLAGALVGQLLEVTGAARPSLDPALLAELKVRDVLAGTEVLTEQAGRGTAAGITPEGALLLERADGSRVTVVAGSVRSIL